MAFRTRNRLVEDLSQRVFSGTARLVVLVIIWASIVHSGSAQCSCYSNHSDLKTWTKSRESCKKNGGDLVSMETLDEWEYIKTQIQGKSTDGGGFNEWYIGLVYQERQRQWKWLSNHNLTYNNKWQPGKPKFHETKKYYAIVAKNYPKDSRGLFNNVRDDIKRGRICEYINAKACDNNPDRWCHDSVSTTTRSTTTTTITSTNTNSDDHEETTVSSTISDGLSGLPSQYPRIPDEKQGFRSVYIIIIALVVLVLVFAVLAVFAYRLKRKRKLTKPRNSHLSKNARVPVKLEHNNSAPNNANDKIIYADVIKMDGGKIQINCDSQDQNVNKTRGVSPYNSKDVICTDRKQKNINQKGNVDYEVSSTNRNCTEVKKTRDAAIKRVDDDKVHLMNDVDGVPDEQDDSSKCLYANIQQPNGSSTIEISQDNNDTSQEHQLLYVQIADIKESNPSCPVKLPSPYSETEYAMIVTTSQNA